MPMQKSDYFYMIADNIMVYQITLPADLQGNRLHVHLNKYDEKYLNIIAGFDKNFLEHFLILSKFNGGRHGVRTRKAERHKVVI